MYFTLFLSIFSLNSCSDLKKGLGIEKDVPNEFLIEKRDPLVLPPDYRLLPPDSKTKPQETKNTKDSLKSVLDGKLNTNESQKTKSSNSESGNLEQEILKKIK